MKNTLLLRLIPVVAAFCVFSVNSQTKFSGIAFDAINSGCSKDSITSDLAFLKQFTDTVRIFGSAHCNQLEIVLESAKDLGLYVYPSIHLDGSKSTFEQELEALVRVLATNQTRLDIVKGIVVGDGIITKAREEGKSDTSHDLIESVKKTKSKLQEKGLDIPVSSAEYLQVYINNTQFRSAVDFIFIAELFKPPMVLPSLPQPNNEETSDMLKIENKANSLVNEIVSSAPVFNYKRVVLESGRSSLGNGDNSYSPENSFAYLSALEKKVAGSNNISFIAYQAFDTGITSNFTFGIFKMDHRTPKCESCLVLNITDPTPPKNITQQISKIEIQVGNNNTLNTTIENIQKVESSVTQNLIPQLNSTSNLGKPVTLPTATANTPKSLRNNRIKKIMA
ncbi:hypothetical protein BB560_003550 [Smittium megazygosporum]|uniref:glucan endo-1,3-beta-D-glucosidase n=1 Tax=Smittium megazygosporum TaxID=133381 RepID=A0A2T9ZBM7_9FUNG|nr:hypothetical protein BB560_003550 [Smittium megazygosporum]